jgi:hypothetical protein
VSHLPKRQLSLRECEAIVDAKDAESRAVFARLHGFDLFRDRAPFDVIIDLSTLIPEATAGCSQRGVVVTDGYLRELVGLRVRATWASEAAVEQAARAMPPGSVVRAC